MKATIITLTDAPVQIEDVRHIDIHPDGEDLTIRNDNEREDVAMSDVIEIKLTN